MKCPSCHQEHGLEVYPGGEDFGRIRPGLQLLCLICPKDNIPYGFIKLDKTEFEASPKVEILDLSTFRVLYGSPFI